MRFEGKRVVVTGGVSGIGKATVEAFIAEGAQVMMGDLDREGGDAMAAHARFDNRLAFQQTDVCNVDELKGLMDNAASHFGGIDIVFNNAGAGAPPVPPDELSVDQWRSVVDVNLTGSFIVARAAFGQMKRQQPPGGRIINNGSISAHTPRPNSAP